MAESRPMGTAMEDLLTALETEMAELRTLAALANPRGYTVVAARTLREEVENAGLRSVDFARIAGVPRAEVDDWLNNRAPAPAWALLTAQLAGQLAPSARRKLLRQPLVSATTPTRGTHPFSRIEDL